jgi:acyl-CoA dehydrogenase family member 9
MMRDARINMIGEGANDVLRVFSALVGMRDVGLQLEGVLRAIRMPFGNFNNLTRFAGRKVRTLLVPPLVDVRSTELEKEAAAFGRLVRSFGRNVEALLRTHQEAILERQYLLGRIADAATELYVSACVLNRLDTALHHDLRQQQQNLAFELATGRYYLRTAARRIRRAFADLWKNDDEATTRLANLVLGHFPAEPE